MGINRQRSNAIARGLVEGYLLTDLIDRSTVFEFYAPGSTAVTFLCVLPQMRRLVLIRALWLR